MAGDRRPWGPGELDAHDLPQCLDCGTCCFSTLPEYLRVFGGDHDRMDDRARALTHFLGNQCFMRMEGGHWIAFGPLMSRNDR